ncbi:Probable F-box protein At5g04010 [Linum perenne]
MSAPEVTHEHASRHETPSWEVQTLLLHYLDGKTLAAAGCVSKSWRDATSSEDIWKKLSTTDFRSFTTTLKTFQPSLPYRRLYILAHTAAAKRRRQSQPPPKPLLSLNRLVFAFHVETARGFHVSFAGPAEEVAMLDANGVFRFDVDFRRMEVEGEGEVRVTWHVVVGGEWKSAFTLMDSVVKVRKEAAGEAVGWISEELPLPGGCCCSGSGRIMVADLKMGFRGDETTSLGDGGEVMRVEKVSIGLLNTESWRYVTVEDGLRYLQHFLLEK